MDKTIVFAFVLLLFLIAVAYYVGTTQVGIAGAKAIQQTLYAVSGRTASGSFAGYPQGGGQPAQITF